jgi:septation ring formation regulator EzrA
MGWYDTISEYRAVGRRLDIIEERLDTLATHILHIEKQGRDNMATAQQVRDVVNKLRDDVAAQTTVVASVHTLLTNLSDLIKALKDQIATSDNVPEDIVTSVTAIDDAINQGKDQLTKDVTDNTPTP